MQNYSLFDAPTIIPFFLNKPFKLIINFLAKTTE